MAIRALSFDADGTLLTLDFSLAIWMESVPQHFARVHRLSLERAMEEVLARYAALGEENFRWFDISFWADEFGLGDPRELIEPHLGQISFFPEVGEVLDQLDGRYRLIVSSNSPREILEAELRDCADRFERIFSVPSDFGMKKGPRYFGKLCDLLELAPDEVVHVGDRYQDDFLAAKAQGLHAFHLDRGGEGGPNKVGNLLEFMERVRDLDEAR